MFPLLYLSHLCYRHCVTYNYNTLLVLLGKRPTFSLYKRWTCLNSSHLFLREWERHMWTLSVCWNCNSTAEYPLHNYIQVSTRLHQRTNELARPGAKATHPVKKHGMDTSCFFLDSGSTFNLETKGPLPLPNSEEAVRGTWAIRLLLLFPAMLKHWQGQAGQA